MKVCYLCFRAFSFARTTSITAGSMDMNIIAMINSLRILLYERKISEKVSCIAEKQYPESAAYQVVDHEIVIVHFTHFRLQREQKVRTIGTNRAMIMVLPPYFL